MRGSEGLTLVVGLEENNREVRVFGETRFVVADFLQTVLKKFGIIYE